MQRANAVRRIVAELTLVRMCDPRLSTSPEAMLSRISALERTVASGEFRTVASDDAVKATVSEPKPETPARVARKVQKNSSDDDDMFRADAPSAIRPRAETSENVERTALQSAGKKVRTLKAFKNRAEALEIMDSKSAMLSSFFKNAKWYSDEEGNIILKYEKQFEIDNMKMFDGEPFFASVISSVTGRPFTIANMKCECDTEKKGDDIIDKIIEAAENA